MDDISLLEKLGYTKKQATVYLTLLALGEATMTTIALKAGLKRPTVYLTIDELEISGLVSVVTKGKKKYYSAAHPRRIAELLEFREKQFEELLPNLVARYGTLSSKPKVQMFEGTRAVQEAYYETFRQSTEIKEALWFGNIGLLGERFPEVLVQYNKILKMYPRLAVRELNYGGTLSREWVASMKNKGGKYFQARYLDPPKIPFGLTDQCILGDKIMLFSLSDEIFMLIIESQEIAQTYRSIYELLWEQAESQ